VAAVVMGSDTNAALKMDLLFDEDPETRKRAKRKREREEANYKRNRDETFGLPTTDLDRQPQIWSGGGPTTYSHRKV
jgi:hypothetical protein